MRVLVTGGAGFIGHHLVHALLRDGHEVSVIDDLSTGFAWRLESVLDRIRFVHGSILDPDALHAAVEGNDAILHEAAIPSVARSIADPIATNEVNVRGTIDLMRAAAHDGVKQVIYAGSSSVYGIPESLPCRETMRAAPLAPYGVSKLAGEHYVHTLGALHGITTVVLRYFNVFGPGQDPNSEYAAVVPKFVTAVLDERQPTINGDGSVSRDFTYVDNVVVANLLAMQQTERTGLTCNIACGDRHSLLELLGAIAAAAGREVEPAFAPSRPGDIRDSLADITLARDSLGYSVQVPFEDGVARTVSWYREDRSIRASAPGTS